MEPLTFFLLWLAAAFALDKNEDLVVLLEDPSGHVGQVVVGNAAGQQLLDTANTVIRVSSSGTPSAPEAISKEEISAVFQGALDAAPEPPQTFLLYFQAGTSTLTDESQSRLQDVVAAFSKRTLARANIIGHTDTVGDADLNYRLALSRADAIRGVLVDAGLAEDEIVVRSHGETDLIVPTGDDTSEPQNRRVEITLW
ncbi:MAG: OmpA family protein [Rhodospirillales bacterium]|nr:OmpA family protein [Rhodospirillales bacterium]